MASVQHGDAALFAGARDFVVPLAAAVTAGQLRLRGHGADGLQTAFPAGEAYAVIIAIITLVDG